MKSKITKPVKILGACVIGIILCLGIYYFVDYILNGSFVDWFEEHYMITQEQYIPEISSNGIVRQPVYSEIKKLLLLVFISVVILGIGITFTVSHFHAKSQTRKAITKISEKMHDFMQSEKEAVEVFPKEYAEISTQMVEIKFTMQRHEQILKEEAARKNDLIAYLAHDLKTPLTSVIGYLSLLDEAVDMPTPQRAKYVSITLDKAKRLEKLINEFFEITRYNLQGIVLEKETIDLYYMLVQMTDEFYPLLQAHQNTTELDVDEEMTIYGDAENLARVFNNILKNAVAYSYPGTVIVAPITSKPDVKAKLPTHCRLDLKNCLNEPSVVLLEQLRTLDKRRLKKYIGKLKKSSMNEVNRALAVSVGLSKFYLCQKECAEHLNQIAENNTRQ